jgi:HlyD family secretion protein
MHIEVHDSRPDTAPVLSLSLKCQSARRSHRLTVAVVMVLFSGLAAVVYQRRAPATEYITQPVTFGDLTITVTTRGNIVPRKLIEIGSELSGTVRQVNVDVNDTIVRGEVLASLDTSRWEAQLTQTQSAVHVAQARLRQAAASVEEAVARATRLLKLRELSGGRLPSQQDLDTSDAVLARARAEYAAAMAAVIRAVASRNMAAADLAKAQIRAPIAGVVLERTIERGQTVTASLQSPVLFVLAEDLRHMELHVGIDEADIGSVQIGQHASFTVDAYPDRMFVARITRVNLASNNTQSASAQATAATAGRSDNAASVVTYETVLEVDNAEGLLRPGMTAIVDIVTGNLQNVPLVSNAAMRFTPERALFPGTKRDPDQGRGLMVLMPWVPTRWRCPRENGQALGCAWVLEQGQPQLAIFKPGATDRTMTQVLPLERLPNWRSLTRTRNDPIMRQALTRELHAGVSVIVGSQQAER